MTDGLTARQTQILKSLIDEYIETTEAVGSEALDKKYNLGVSPATIRNEMVALTKMGFLRQLHTSAGRIPSPRAMKFYIDQLMEEKQMSLADEVKAKEEVWDSRRDMDKLLDEATHALADRTQSLAVAAVDDYDKVWHAGYANVFSNPEFANLELCGSLFSLLEEEDKVFDMFFKWLNPGSVMDVLFGEEMGWPNLSPVSVVTTHFDIYGKHGALGIIGPARLSYARVIPILRYFGNLLTEVTR